MISSIARWIVVAGAIALHGVVVASGSAVAQSPALRLAGPGGLSNRYDPPVSETEGDRFEFFMDHPQNQILDRIFQLRSSQEFLIGNLMGRYKTKTPNLS